MTAKAGRCLCGSDDVRLYACGWRCLPHSPARQAGLPDPGQGRYCAPFRCYCGECPSWTSRPVYVDDLQRLAVDAEAVKSGKRRSSLTGYRNAQAARS